MEWLTALYGQVDEGNALREVSPGRGIVAQIEQGLPQCVVGLKEVRRRRLMLGQTVEFFAQL
jgi:hypothetical protein